MISWWEICDFMAQNNILKMGGRAPKQIFKKWEKTCPKIKC